MFSDQPPVDPRSRLFAGDVDCEGRLVEMSRHALIARTARWPTTRNTPTGVVGLLRRSRALYVDGLHEYESFADAATKSLQAVEAALALRADGRRTFEKMIDLAHAEMAISDDDRERLHAGRKLRNSLVHAQAPTIWTPAVAAQVIAASHHAVASVFPDT